MNGFYIFSTDPFSQGSPITENKLQPVQQPILPWKEFPVLVTKNEFHTMDMPSVKRIIFGKLLSPSQQALLKFEELLEFPKSIDSLFHDVIEKYKKGLLEASSKDNEKMQPMEVKNELLAIGNKSSGGAFKGHLYEISAHRVAWLKTIDVLEKERSQKMQKIIQIRCQDLYNELESSKANNNIIDLSSIKELKQLYKIHHYVCVNQTIFFGRKTLQNYLKDDCHVHLEDLTNVIDPPDVLNEEWIEIGIQNVPSLPKEGNINRIENKEQEKNPIIEPKEVTLYREKAEQGDAQSQFNIGWCYANGFGVLADMQKAIDWYQKANEAEIAEAEYNLGLFNDSRMELYSNPDEAFKLFLRSAERGFAPAQYMVGYYYSQGIVVGKSETKAVEWYQKGANQKNPFAQHALGECCQSGKGTQQNSRQAFKLFLASAEQGYGKAQAAVGLCYKSGRGTAKDEMPGIEWCSKAAKQEYKDKEVKLSPSLKFMKFYQCARILDQKNITSQTISYSRLEEKEGKSENQENAESLYKQGLAYEKEKNYEKAVECYRKSANKDLAAGKYALGLCYSEGQGVEKDVKLAFNLFFEAADQNFAAALTTIGRFQLFGSGEIIYKDVKECVFWFMRAAEQGYLTAMTELAEYYRKNLGEFGFADHKKEIVNCVRWYEMAAEHKDHRAMHELGNFYTGKDLYGYHKDIEKSVHWYQKAADLGYTKSQFELGKILYEDSDFRDRKKAYELMKKVLEKENELNKSEIEKAKDIIWNHEACIIL